MGLFSKLGTLIKGAAKTHKANRALKLANKAANTKTAAAIANKTGLQAGERIAVKNGVVKRTIGTGRTYKLGRKWSDTGIKARQAVKQTALRTAGAVNVSSNLTGNKSTLYNPTTDLNSSVINRITSNNKPSSDLSEAATSRSEA